MEEEEFSCVDYTGNLEDQKESQRVLQITAVTLIVVSVLVVLLSYGYYLTQRKGYESLRRRNLFLQSAFVVGSLILIFNYSLRAYFGVLNYSCRLYSLLTTAQLILLLQSAWIRLFSLIWRINYNKLLISQTYLALAKGQLKSRPGSVRFVSINAKKKLSTQQTFYGSSFKEHGPQLKEDSSSFCMNYVGACVFACFTKVLRFKSSDTLPYNLQLAQLLASNQFAVVLFLVQSVFVTILVLAVEFTFLPFGETCFGCGFVPSIYVNLGFMGVTGILGVYAFWKLRTIDDGLGIRKEIIVLAVMFIVDGLISLIILAIALSDYEKEGQVETTLFSVFSVSLGAIYMFPYQVRLAKQKTMGKINAGDNGTLLRKILKSPEYTQAYAVFLASNLSLENLFFYNAIQNWKENYDSMTEDARIEAANSIYGQFIKKNALLEINISDNCFENIRESIESEITKNMFDDAMDTVWGYLVSDTFRRFKLTAYYKATLNELQVEDML